MQEARIKEIQRRLGTDNDGQLTPMGEDVQFLLTALQDAQDKNKQQIEIKNNLATLYSQSQAREQQLQAKNHDLELSIAAVRAANDTWKTIVTELREELIKIKNVWQ